MALLKTPEAQLGSLAPEFNLISTQGGFVSDKDIQKDNGMLVAFICNHCPYVKAIAERMAQQFKKLQGLGVGVVAICANDAENYPEDSLENMKKFAQENQFSFSYLQDESQAVARAYSAVCTPDFFGYDSKRKLVYRGRLDDCVMDPPQTNTIPELLNAMTEVAQGKEISQPQLSSMGCSIKWKSPT